MFDHLKMAAASVKNPGRKILQFGPWSRGLMTVKSPERANTAGCGELKNFVLVDDGLARSRPGLVPLYPIEDDLPGEIRFVKDIKVAGVWSTYIATYDEVRDETHIYEWDGSVQALIVSFSGEREVRFVGFSDTLIIFDGHHIKRFDGTSVELVYDDGTGAAESNYQFNNRFGSEDETLPLGNGTNTAVIFQFASASWEAGFTIPPTRFFATVSRAGNGFTGTDNVPVYFQIYERAGSAPNIATDTKCCELVFLQLAGNVSSTAMEYDVIIPASSFVSGWTGLDSSTSYYAVLSYNNGDAGNYINVHVSRVTGSVAGVWSGAWSATPNQLPMMGLRPGADVNNLSGLKAVDGIVHGGRIFVIEGESGVHPDRVWYSGVENVLDWSSENYAGWLGTGKDIGGIASFYNEVWVFGTVRMPYLSRLAGALPSEFVLSESIQPVSGHYRSLVTGPDDIFFAHPQGADSVSTMQSFGDVRAISMTEDVKNIFQEFYAATAFAAYEPNFGLYLIKLNDLTERIWVIHTKMKGARKQGALTIPAAPVSVWEFSPYFGGIMTQEITALGVGENCCYIGTDYGLVYKIDPDANDDNGAPIDCVLKSNYLSTGLGEAAAWRCVFDVFGENGGNFDLRFYRNHERTVWHEILITLPDITGGDDPSDFFDRENLNFNFRGLMISVEDVNLGNGPVFIGPISVEILNVEGF